MDLGCECNCQSKIKLIKAKISASAKHGFIQDRALACELSGRHYRRIKDFANVSLSFVQSRECYCTRGSQLR
eukprot:scaffold3406_cov295-Alexandrium_tamarense.AAC.2